MFSAGRRSSSSNSVATAISLSFSIFLSFSFKLEHKEQLPKITHKHKAVSAREILRVPTVSRLGFGCSGLTGTYGTKLSHEDGCLLIKDAFTREITFFDTSDLYGDIHGNEVKVGKALKQLPRDKIQLATKFGIAKKGINYTLQIKGTLNMLGRVVKLV